MRRDPLRTTAAAAADIADLADQLAELSAGEIHPTVRAYARIFAGGCRVVSRGAGALAAVQRRPLEVFQDDRYLAAAFGDDLVELEGMTAGEDRSTGEMSPVDFAAELFDAIQSEKSDPSALPDGSALCVRCGAVVAGAVQSCPTCGGGTFLEAAP